jgi:hypothetical protein
MDTSLAHPKPNGTKWVKLNLSILLVDVGGALYVPFLPPVVGVGERADALALPDHHKLIIHLYFGLSACHLGGRRNDGTLGNKLGGKQSIESSP